MTVKQLYNTTSCRNNVKNMKRLFCCFIFSVVRWPLLFLNISVPILAQCFSVRAFAWDGLEGSFGIFGLRASLVGMPNVPESEGMVGVGFMLMLLY